MDIVSATVLLAAATISVPVIAWGLNKVPGLFRHQPISPSKKEALCRIWKGYYQIMDGAGVVKSKEPLVKIDLSFSINGRRLIGTGHYTDRGKTVIVIEGYLKNDRVLVLEYKNNDDAKFHFGNMILSLNSDANELTGYLIAFGRKPDGLVVGYIKLNTL